MEELIRRWRQLGVWLPVVFVAAVAAVAVLGFGRFLSDVAVIVLITGITALGALGFSSWVFRVLGQAERETEQRARYLAAIDEASLALSSDLDLDSVLQRVVDLSCEVTGADYGALALLGDDGEIAEFLTSGMSPEQREHITRLPEGKGLLGLVIREGKTLRIDRLAGDSDSAGFPSAHPFMTSFLGLPIVYEGRIVGDLYQADKNGGQPFTEHDEEMLRTFAAHAAVAIENARLYGRMQDLAVLEERDRIGMDLHDGVIQSLYGTGLTLENCLLDLDQDLAQVQPQLQKVIQDLNQTIADIRSYIFNLQPAVLAGTDLAGACGALLKELKVNALLGVQLIEEPEACHSLTEEQVSALYHVVQEALTNVRKHAQASSVTTRLERNGDTFRLAIEDDGVGFDPIDPGAGLGLGNIRDRVEALGGRLHVRSASGRGTRLTIEVPVAKEGVVS